MTYKSFIVFLGISLFFSRFPSYAFAQICAPNNFSQPFFQINQPPPRCEEVLDNNALLKERAGGCFTDCFLNPFGSEECDACRNSASDPMPEWNTTEKILWSLGGLLLAAGMIWLSGTLNGGNNCNSSAACANYGYNPYPYYSDPYYSGGSGYYGSAFAKKTPILHPLFKMRMVGRK